jgi:hypothetical protein
VHEEGAGAAVVDVQLKPEPLTARSRLPPHLIRLRPAPLRPRILPLQLHRADVAGVVAAAGEEGVVDVAELVPVMPLLAQLLLLATTPLALLLLLLPPAMRPHVGGVVDEAADVEAAVDVEDAVEMLLHLRRLSKAEARCWGRRRSSCASSPRRLAQLSRPLLAALLAFHCLGRVIDSLSLSDVQLL